jgi:MFS family permease
MLHPLLTPLLSLFIYVLGSQSLSIYLTIILTGAGYSQLEVGILNAMGYLGLFASGFYTDRLVHSLGHPKTFILSSLLAGLLSGVFFLEEAYFSLLFLRFIFGWVVGLMYVVIESWVLSTPPQSQRGQHLASYMIVLYCSQALSPFLLDINFNPPKILFIVAGCCCLLSVLPILYAKHEGLSMHEGEMVELNIVQLFKRSHTGFLGCVVSGIVTAAYSSLIPYYAIKAHYDVPLLMSSFIAGGALFQWPFERSAEFFGRKPVLAFLSCSMLLPTLMFLYTNHESVVISAIFISGALIFALYPISIGLTCEALKTNEIITASKTLLLAYSLGCIVGVPMIAGLMEFFSMNSLLFLFTGVIAGLFGIHIIQRILISR